MVIRLPQHFIVSVGETRICRANFTDDLDSGVTLVTTTSYPTATSASTDLTLATSDCYVNAATYTESLTGDTVAVGKAIVFSIAGGSAANSPYEVTLSGKTSSTPPEILVRKAVISFQ